MKEEIDRKIKIMAVDYNPSLISCNKLSNIKCINFYFCHESNNLQMLVQEFLTEYLILEKLQILQWSSLDGRKNNFTLPDFRKQIRFSFGLYGV